MSDLPTPEETFRIDVEQRGNVVIARLSGSANMDVCGSLQDRLYELVESPVNHIVLDLSDLDFMSSVGLGAILAAHLRCRHRDCVIKLVSPKPRILELLDVTRLTRVFDVFKTIDEAVAL